jgi:hypothetical protein
MTDGEPADPLLKMGTRYSHLTLLSQDDPAPDEQRRWVMPRRHV